MSRSAGSKEFLPLASFVRDYVWSRLLGVAIFASGVWRLLAPASIELRCSIAWLSQTPIGGRIATSIVPNVISAIELACGFGLLMRRYVGGWLLLVLAQVTVVATLALVMSSPGFAESGLGLFPVFHSIPNKVISIGIASAQVLVVWCLIISRASPPLSHESRVADAL